MERSTWHLLKAQGSLTCPVSKTCDDPIFRDAYGWMMNSMANAGVPAPAFGLSPWWCWVSRGQNHPEPYIEDLAGLDDPVVLELSIPSDQIVLSCFDLWHFVLNRSYVWTSESDEKDFDKAIEGAQGGGEQARQLEARLQDSWSAIFDLDQAEVDMGAFEIKSIQGCFWTLTRDNVVALIERDVLTSYDHL
jgi:hypothetical protein